MKEFNSVNIPKSLNLAITMVREINESVEQIDELLEDFMSESESDERLDEIKELLDSIKGLL